MFFAFMTIIVIISIYAHFYFNKYYNMETIHKVIDNIRNYHKFRKLTLEEQRSILKDGETLFDRFHHSNLNSEELSPSLEMENMRYQSYTHQPHYQDRGIMIGFKNNRRFTPHSIAKKIYIYNDNLLYYVNGEMYDSGEKLNRSFFPFLVGFSFTLILILLYYLVLKSLKPLKSLEISIRKFGEGELDVTLNLNSNDEVARIAKEFDKAVKKIGDLERSRELFLRNIIHELKTPITKGKLIVALLGKNKNTEMLNRVFNRLDSLINEMANIEQLVSQNESINFSVCKISDVLNEAIRLGFLKREKIEILDFQDIFIEADIKFLAIAFKNLLDNGIRYSKDNRVQVSVYDDDILFISKGERLKNDFTSYLKPFNHSQITSKKGFGLGMYITNEIITKHNFKMSYHYVNGKNIFSIHINREKSRINETFHKKINQTFLKIS